MFINSKYYKFFKLTKISSFLSIPIKNKDNFFKYKIQMFFNFYGFYDLWKLVLFFYKIRLVFKKLIVSKSFLSIISNENKLIHSLQFFFSAKNLIFFSRDKFLFENKYFFKNFIRFKNLLCIENINSFYFMSFVFLVLNRYSRIDKQKILELVNQKIPILFLSESFFKNCYQIPSNLLDWKKSFFWLFLVFNIFFEEFILRSLNESRKGSC